MEGCLDLSGIGFPGVLDDDPVSLDRGRVVWERDGDISAMNADI